MDPYLIQKVSDRNPKFNRSITNGLAVEHMMGKVSDGDTLNRTVAYIDRLFMINQELFPPGFQYVGARPCTPMEHFEEVTKEFNSKRNANVAREDAYMVSLQFQYNGEMLIPKRILLPYVNEGGLIHLNGALYNIAPVLTDIGYSVLQGSIFIPFRRTKLTFSSEDYHFLVNGQRSISYVIWSLIHRKMKNVTKRDVNKRRLIHSCLPHYFFARDGVVEAFAHWAGVKVEIGYSHEFPYETYPKDEYLRFESIVLKGNHPTGELCLVVPKEDDSDFIRLMVAGFFYVVDTFPDSFSDPTYASNPIQWQRLLGQLIYGDYRHPGMLHEDIKLHLESFSLSLDEMTREDLRERDVHVKDAWELLYKIMTDLVHHFYQRNTDESSVYGKRLVVLRYVLEELNHAISSFAYNFQSLKNKKENGTGWTVDELNKHINAHFKLKTAMKALTSEHGEINTVSYPGDNKFFRLTSMLIPQDKARRKKGPQKGLVADTTKLLHPSIAEVCQFNNQPKNNPDGRGRIGPCVLTEVDGTIKRNEKFRELLDNIEQLLRR